MSWLTTSFTSSLGKKFIVGSTGLFLCTFLLVHVGINSLIFVNDGGELFNLGAEFMGTNPLIRFMEIFLMLGLLAHIVQSLLLQKQNADARPIGYSAYDGKANSKWYSRSMAILGILLLTFLILHLKHFWIISRFTDEITSGRETLFGEMKEIFESPIVVIIYVLAQISLGYHLLHGFQSGFQTMGWNHKKYTPIIETVGLIISVVFPILFAAMPIAMYFKWIQ